MEANLGSENGDLSKEPSSVSQGAVVSVVDMQGRAVVTADKGLSIPDSISRSEKQNRSKTYNVYSKISQARPS